MVDQTSKQSTGETTETGVLSRASLTPHDVTSGWQSRSGALAESASWLEGAVSGIKFGGSFADGSQHIAQCDDQIIGYLLGNKTEEELPKDLRGANNILSAYFRSLFGLDLESNDISDMFPSEERAREFVQRIQQSYQEGVTKGLVDVFNRALFFAGIKAQIPQSGGKMKTSKTILGKILKGTYDQPLNQQHKQALERVVDDLATEFSIWSGNSLQAIKESQAIYRTLHQTDLMRWYNPDEAIIAQLFGEIADYALQAQGHMDALTSARDLKELDAVKVNVDALVGEIATSDIPDRLKKIKPDADPTFDTKNSPGIFADLYEAYERRSRLLRDEKVEGIGQELFDMQRDISHLGYAIRNMGNRIGTENARFLMAEMGKLTKQRSDAIRKMDEDIQDLYDPQIHDLGNRLSSSRKVSALLALATLVSLGGVAYLWHKSEYAKQPEVKTKSLPLPSDKEARAKIQALETRLQAYEKRMGSIADGFDRAAQGVAQLESYSKTAISIARQGMKDADELGKLVSHTKEQKWLETMQRYDNRVRDIKRDVKMRYRRELGELRESAGDQGLTGVQRRNLATKYRRIRDNRLGRLKKSYSVIKGFEKRLQARER